MATWRSEGHWNQGRVYVSASNDDVSWQVWAKYGETYPPSAETVLEMWARLHRRISRSRCIRPTAQEK